MRISRTRLTVIAFVIALAAGGLFLSPQTIAARGTPATAEQGSAPVTIVNPLPLPITDINRAAQTPIQFNFVPDWLEYVVPADKRLVIEFVSGSCEVETPGRVSGAYLTTTAGGRKTPHSFIPVLTASTPDVSIQVFSHATRIYADPGTEVFATVATFGGSGSCSSVTFSGHLTNP